MILEGFYNLNDSKRNEDMREAERCEAVREQGGKAPAPSVRCCVWRELRVGEAAAAVQQSLRGQFDFAFPVRISWSQT